RTKQSSHTELILTSDNEPNRTFFPSNPFPFVPPIPPMPYLPVVHLLFPPTQTFIYKINVKFCESYSLSSKQFEQWFHRSECEGEKMEENRGSRTNGSDENEKTMALISKEEDTTTKGGFRTIPFIILNEGFQSLASTGLHANMVIYLTKEFQMLAVAASSIISLWSAASSFLAIFGAVLSDSLLGRFTVILLGSFLTPSLLVDPGTIVLWLTAILPQLRPPPCDQLSITNCGTPATITQLAILYTSLGLISLGAGCLMPCSMAFGADQLDHKDNPNNERALQGFFNWYYATGGVATLLGVTVLVYIQDNYGWGVGLAVPAFLVLFSTLLFLLPSSIYVKHEARGSLFVGCFRVLVVAIRKQGSNNNNVKDEQLTLRLHESLDDNSHRYFHGHDNDENEFIMPTPILRWLNRACLILNPETDINPDDGTAKNPWTLCTVEEVEAVKSIIKVLPIWSTGLLFHLSLTQTPFVTLQAQIMNRHIFTTSFEIPAGSLNSFIVISFTLSIILYDSTIVPILSKITGNPRGLTTNARLGAGMVMSISAMAISGATEAMRRRNNTSKQEAAQDMSVLWLLPSLGLLGMAHTLNSIQQISFYYSQLPKSMSSIAISIFTLGAAIGSLLSSVLIDVVDRFTSSGGKESWLSTDLNEGHLDYYYWLIAGISSVNFVYFLVCIRL
ncbi:Protein NRT1/ PTR FAMILY 1.2, partial [Linum perenne]